MGILGRLFGRGVSKEKLIRNLARKRVQSDPTLADVDVDGIGSVLLMGLPEATIVCIVETYWIMKRQGNLSDEEILEAIEAHRSMLGEAGTMPSPLKLSSYIKYRLSLEHSHGAPISIKFVDEAIEEANSVFGPSVK